MALDKLLRHQTETPAALRTFRGDVPGELQLLVSRLLAKSPEDRMQSAAEVAVTLVPLCVSDSLRVKRTRTVTRSGSRSSSMAPTRVLPVEPVPAAASAPEDDEAAPLIRPRSGPTTRARRWRWRFAGVAGVALLLALVFLVGGSRKNASAPVAKEATKSPVPAKDHLANHVPPDSVAFSSVRLREIRESAIFRKIGQPRMSLDPVTQSLAQMLRIDPDKDLDEVRSSVSATSEGSIWTARGAFDSGKFVRGTELTSLARHEGDELFRVRPTGQSPSYLGVRGEYLIGGLDRKRIEAMLAQTRLGSALPVADADLSKLLDVVERKRSLWFVAVPPRLPATPQVSDARPAQNVVSYLLDRAATLEGGARFGRSLEVSLTLEGRTPRASREMALHLNWVKLLASSASVKGEPSLEKRLWMLLLRNLEVTTTDRGIHVRALVTPEMLD